MSKKATAKNVPREILDMIRQEFNASVFNNMPRGTGKWSFIPNLQKALQQFLQDQKQNFPDLATQYPKGPTEDLLRRAFNLKSPPGATKSLRDLLCLYATQGKYDWNKTIELHFPDRYASLLDDDRTESVSPSQNTTPNIDTFASRVAEILLEKLSAKEVEVVKKQIMDDAEEPSELLDDLSVPSYNDPDNPEFPPKPFYTPKFPASATYKIDVPGFSNVWLKDESTNPTGTHKDRMAWEVLIKAKRYNVREISLISSGSAAVSIQNLLNLYKVPTLLKVLIDFRMNPEVKNHLKRIGCVVYETDLSLKPLTGKEIKELTNNEQGIDITYREILDRYNDNYYDWLSYEILNGSPDYCFIPFGTGDLFINVLIIAEREFNNRIFKHDPRFRGDINVVSRCQFIGATSRTANTRLDKLFSYHLPSLNDYNEYLSSLIENRRIGSGSSILDVEEEYIEEALELARRLNITCEPSGIAGLALLLQTKPDIPKDAKILVVNTGKTNYNIPER